MKLSSLPEGAVTPIAHAGEAPEAGFWTRLQELADTRSIPKAFRPQAGLSLLPLMAYLPLVVEPITEAATERPDNDWRIGLDLSRAKDLEQNVFPRLAYAMRRMAADGEAPADLMLAVLEFQVRELLRAGGAPVMYKIPPRKEAVN